jgi:hypothetical protein
MVGVTGVTHPDNNVVLTEFAALQLRDDFIGWQCRLRQLSARQARGRPLDGMRPRLLSPAGDELSPGIIVLIVEHDSVNNTQMLRFQCQKTNDPIERYDRVLELLSSAYFQHPKNFSDEMTAGLGTACDPAASRPLRAGVRTIHRSLPRALHGDRTARGARLLSGDLLAQPHVQPQHAPAAPHPVVQAGLAPRQYVANGSLTPAAPPTVIPGKRSATRDPCGESAEGVLARTSYKPASNPTAGASSTSGT